VDLIIFLVLYVIDFCISHFISHIFRTQATSVTARPGISSYDPREEKSLILQKLEPILLSAISTREASGLITLDIG
jgi:hypothetical protein